MESLESATRRYRSVLRDQQAERTRLLVAQAARSRFLEAGWAGTTVRSVAAAAGVSEATVYAIYGNKAGLARSLIDYADAEANVKRLLSDLEKAAGDPVAQLGAQVGFDRRLFEHSGDVLRVIVEGRRQEPDLAAAYSDGRSRGERGRRQLFGSWPAATWKAGVGVQRALDVYAVLCSIESYDVATSERRWSPAKVERWWHQTLVQQLLA